MYTWMLEEGSISLWMVVSHQVDAGDWTLELWNSSQCSYLLSHRKCKFHLRKNFLAGVLWKRKPVNHVSDIEKAKLLPDFSEGKGIGQKAHHLLYLRLEIKGWSATFWKKLQCSSALEFLQSYSSHPPLSSPFFSEPGRKLEGGGR